MDSPPPSDVLSIEVSTDGGNAAVHSVLTLDDRKQGRERVLLRRQTTDLVNKENEMEEVVVTAMPRVLSSKDHQQQLSQERPHVKHDGVSSVLSKVRL